MHTFSFLPGVKILRSGPVYIYIWTYSLVGSSSIPRCATKSTAELIWIGRKFVCNYILFTSWPGQVFRILLEYLRSWIGSVRVPPGSSAFYGCRGRRIHGGDHRGEHDVAFVPFFFRVNSVSGCTRRKISFLFSLSSKRNKLLCHHKCYLIVRLESTQVDRYGL